MIVMTTSKISFAINKKVIFADLLLPDRLVNNDLHLLCIYI